MKRLYLRMRIFCFFVGKMEDGKWTLAGDFGNAGVSLEGIESSEKTNRQSSYTTMRFGKVYRETL